MTALLCLLLYAAVGLAFAYVVVATSPNWDEEMLAYASSVLVFWPLWLIRGIALRVIERVRRRRFERELRRRHAESVPRSMPSKDGRP